MTNKEIVKALRDLADKLENISDNPKSLREDFGADYHKKLTKAFKGMSDLERQAAISKSLAEDKAKNG